ncbi:MAG TPA: glycosyltransferase family 2 protein [Anaeromyxobacteraceae bacterium]|nr:glycosyltransferase family 2 protein [Anaeromyxobacteraceae bacterium]
MPDVSVVIPVHDEGAILRTACLDLAQGLSARGLNYEVVLCENGSRDATRAELASLAAEHPRLRWLSIAEPNYGLALREGILEARGRLVVCDEIDLCDLSFYDRALPLLESGGAEMVVGSKRAPGAQDRRPRHRRLATWAHNTMLRLLLGFRGTDTHGPKAMLRERLAPVAGRCQVDRDVFASELVIRAQREGVRMVEIPLTLRERRPPSVGLWRRVPSVLARVAKLVWVLRLAPSRAPPAAEGERAPPA